MPVYKTGRSRTLRFEGVLSGSQSSAWSCHNPGTPDETTAQDTYVRPIYSFGALGAEFFGRATEGGSVPIPGDCSSTGQGQYGTQMRVQLPAFGVDSGLQTYTDGSFTRPGSFSRSVTGEWSVEVEVEEYVAIDALPVAQIDGFGFPREPLIDLDGRITGYGDAQPDGLPGYQLDFYEVAKIGSQLVATMTLNGHTLSESVEITALNQFPIVKTWGGGIDYGFRCANSVTVFGTSGSLNMTAELQGEQITAPWSDSKFDAEANANSTCYLWADDTLGVGAFCTSDFAIFPPSIYQMVGQARCFDQAYPVSATVRWLYKTDLDLLLHTRTFSLAPSGTDTYSQVRYGCTADLNGTGADGEARDDWHAVRAWLDVEALSAAGEDPRDWRLQGQWFPWQGLTISQVAQTVVSAGANVDPDDNEIPLTEDNWEGYRYLEFTATLAGASSRDLELVVGQKRYPFTATDVGAAVTIDLCDPTNRPGIRLDRRDSRFPLDIDGPTYGPTDGTPKTDQDEEEEQGWLWGVLERPEAVTIEGLQTGDSCDLTALTLSRESSAEAGVLCPFRQEQELWESPTDHTYGALDLWLYSDGKQVGPWPFLTHVVPKSGPGESYGWYTLTQLSSFVDSTPGWDGEVQSSRTHPSLASSSATKLMSGSLEAGHLGGYEWDGSAWVDQAARDIDAGDGDLRLSFKSDVVDGYPGMGDPEFAYGPLNYSVPVRFSKLLRAQAEGLTLLLGGPESGGTVFLKTKSGLLDAGQGTSDARGIYRTGTPWAKGNILHLTRKQKAGDEPASGTNWALHVPWSHYHQLESRGSPGQEEWRSANRYRGRTSFTRSRPQWRRSQRIHPPFEGSWDLPDGTEFRAAFLPEGGGLLATVFASGGDVLLASTSDDGESHGEPEMVLENAIHPTIAAIDEGHFIVAGFRYDAGTEGPGTIVAKVKSPDGWSSEMTFLDSGGLAISFEDDTFHFTPAPDGSGLLVLVARKAGETGPSAWYSADHGPSLSGPTLTWTEL